MTGNAAREITMPHASGRMVSAAIRKRGPAENRNCAPGTCYEGSCLGDKVYSTDGTCGEQHGGRRCAGEWGDCCSVDGKCGTGTAFCGWTKCQSGQCIIPPGVLPYRASRDPFSGNTTDGRCGGANNYVCNEAFGLCCNKNGKCGGGPSDCGAGCQSRYGSQCSSASPTTTPAPTTTILGNNIVTPTPYQASMVSDCDEFYQVNSTDTCASIAASAGISLASFYAWNPDIGSNTCKTLKPNYYVCIDIQSCTTNSFGLVVPQPSGASCGVEARSNGGVTIDAYNSGKPISSLVNCKNACLNTIGCTNFYYIEGKACNLHAGQETHVASSTADFLFYDSACFVCPSKCLSASSPPAGAACNVQAVSDGGTTIISYNSSASIQSISAWAATCLATTGCTNLYYTPGKYCNLHAGTETHKPSLTSQYYFYDASCFECASPSCRTDSQGLAVPQPSSAVCNVVAYSNGGTTIASYSSGEAIKSLKACSAECLATSGCTNLYYEAGEQCNLHSGVETHNPNPSAPFVFYEASCFEC
ncbi:hypothetical protein F5B18DRAFT_228642 [Nemania serpens]|nr:hypothetical protein F5B18DRAFT_228642 [Nemania serpens]